MGSCAFVDVRIDAFDSKSYSMYCKLGRNTTDESHWFDVTVSIQDHHNSCDLKSASSCDVF